MKHLLHVKIHGHSTASLTVADPRLWLEGFQDHIDGSGKLFLCYNKMVPVTTPFESYRRLRGLMEIKEPGYSLLVAIGVEYLWRRE